MQRNNAEILCSLSAFPPMSASCKTVVQFQNRDINIGIIKMQNVSPITTSIPPVAFIQPHLLPSFPLPSLTVANVHLLSISIICHFRDVI